MMTGVSPFRFVMLLSLVLVGVSLGCVRRTVTITTAPEGATVILNDEEIGTSPVNTDFTWYGDYDVIIRKDGYKTLQTHHQLKQPWYEYPPIDFVAEALLPTTIHDQRAMHFELEPAQPLARDALIEQAGEFRQRALFTEE